MKAGIKILVANRGEIAVRILRTCRELGIPSVAVYTNVDQLALHIRYADEAISIGERTAYLDIKSILTAAKKTGATIIHPGYGFLSENSAFASAVEEAGLTFVGPRPLTIALLGDKLASRQAAHEAGLPVLPGSDRPLPPELPLEMAAQITYPVLVKAAAGGGGRGIRLARSAEELPQVVEVARQEALAAFGDDTVFLESMVQQARHIEVQILGDGHGNILCLGERECSIQRRRQKLIEEAPAPALSANIRSRLYDAAFRLTCLLKYRGLGTVEFLLDSKNDFHFIEVNPRIQVEHPVTEMVTGMDLVKEQLLLALGSPLRTNQEQVELRGAAIEARVLAEDPMQDFLPTTGQVTYLKEPGGPGIRVDSALYQGMEVCADYDSLLAKVIAWSENRPTTIRRLSCALDEFQIGGLDTDLEFLKQIINSPRFVDGNVTTTYLEEFKTPQTSQETELERTLALAAALYTNQRREQQSLVLAGQPNQWQQAAWLAQMPNHS
jgi:acetyl-CoA carboxylase, biotin carboxylase subunit